MGLLSNRIHREDLKPGDHIYSWRTAYIYAHHGIYVGDDTVIHFTRRGREGFTGMVLDRLLVNKGQHYCYVPVPFCTCIPPAGYIGVISSCLNCFLAGGVLCRFEYGVSPAHFLAQPRGGTCTLAGSDPAEEVVHRAKYLLENGFVCYNLFKSNCEHFANYCKTGLLVVNQATIGQSGQSESIVHGSLAALGLATKNVYWMTWAATFVGSYFRNRYANDIGVRKNVVKVRVEELTRALTTGLIQLVDP